MSVGNLWCGHPFIIFARLGRTDLCNLQYWAEFPIRLLLLLLRALGLSPRVRFHYPERARVKYTLVRLDLLPFLLTKDPQL